MTPSLFSMMTLTVSHVFVSFIYCTSLICVSQYSYDAVISGCLQWTRNTQKKRLPCSTSDNGWKLLEEIMYMMEWKDRQEEKRQLLTMWIDDDEDDNNIDDDDTDDEKEQTKQKRKVTVKEEKKEAQSDEQYPLIRDPDADVVFNLVDIDLTTEGGKGTQGDKDGDLNKKTKVT